MTGPHIAQGMPVDASWFARQIEDLQRQLRELRAAQTLNAATIGAGGLTIEGGLLLVKDADGNTVCAIGTYPATGDVAVTTFRASDGTIAFQNFGDFAGFRDRAGFIVVSDDATSGTGLASPHINGGFTWYNTNIASWPATTAAAFTDIAAGWYQVWNPYLRFGIVLQVDASTTAEFRLMVNGTQVDSTQTVTGGFATWNPARTTLPLGITIGQILTISLQGRVTVGAGTARAVFTYLNGEQS